MNKKKIHAQVGACNKKLLQQFVRLKIGQQLNLILFHSEGKFMGRFFF